MKSSLLLPCLALTSRALATKAQLNAHDIQDLVARAIDPTTMDPVRLSVLSVMRTAIPSGPDFPRPTNGVEPEWWQKLPADVKSLLPVLYPATETVVASSSGVASAEPLSVLASTYTSQLTVTKTLQYVPSASAGFGMSVNGTSITPTPTNGSLHPAASSTPAPFAGGASGRSDVELFAAVAWVGVATGFFLFG
ncbi:hypothetical protein DE146DRAFT_374791 [Phaeosphaeria sp. MPI-PUGE-AT-0046c]|nr:hypothetical protein DE146DRAFT_374791 [Phaeosphaeria sp. MPI-PUGE-AT-0046c]